MAVDDLDVIDIVSTPNSGGEVVLTVCDHLPWDRDNEHLAILQGKLNLYLDFIQTGQLTEQYPQYAGRPLRIDVACLHRPSRDGTRLLELCRDALEPQGWSLSWSWPAKGEADDILALGGTPARRPKAKSGRGKSAKRRTSN